MSNENKSNTQGNSKPMQMQFTRIQSQTLSKMLPEGYTLELLSKLKKESSSHRSGTKKVFTNDGNAAVVKKNGTARLDLPPLVTTPSESTMTPPSKRVLRDKKPSNSYLEDRFPEVIPPPAPSSKAGKLTPEGMKKCSDLLRRLKKHKCAGPFLHPVDVEGLGLYDYYDVVSEPMDLSTVEKKLKAGEYASIHDFGLDLRKIWANALAYNSEGSSIYQMTFNMKTYFEKIYKEIAEVQFNDKVKDLEEQVKMLTQAVSQLTRPEPALVPPKSNKAGGGVARSPATPSEKEMTVKEKKVLCEQIKKLPAEALRGVWHIVSKGLPSNQANQEELVFDIDILPVKVTRELEKYVKSKISHSAPQNPRSHAKGSKSSQVHHPQQTHAPAPLISNPPPEIQEKRQRNDADSKSSDSSFISDSESGSDDEKRHKAQPIT